MPDDPDIAVEHVLGPPLADRLTRPAASVPPEKLDVAIQEALLAAYKEQPGSAKYVRVELDPETAEFRVIELIVPERLEAQLIAEATTYDPETGELVVPSDAQIDPAKLEEHKDQLTERDVTPADFGGIAAQTARRLISRRIREAERDTMFDEDRHRVGELVTALVVASESGHAIVQLLGGGIAVLPKSEQVKGERDRSQPVAAVIKKVSRSTTGPSIIVSRRDPELVKKLFEREVPEIADGLVEIVSVAREPGYRSKIAVVSHTDGVDPVGACVGPRGSRMRMVVSELRGEKIDVVPYGTDPARFIAKALAPARVREVLLDHDAKLATVVVPDDELWPAIGREGQNARLAARLTGWRIEVTSESELRQETDPDPTDERLLALSAEIDRLRRELVSARAEVRPEPTSGDEVAIAFAAEVHALLGDVPPADDAVRRAARLAVAEQAWSQRLGHLLDSRDAGAAIGVSPRQIRTLVKTHRLIALPGADRLRLPAWQFAVASAQDRAVLGRAHWMLVDEGGIAPWSAASWFLSPHPELDGKDPIAWLRENRDRDQVIEVARRDAARAAQ